MISLLKVIATFITAYLLINILSNDTVYIEHQINIKSTKNNVFMLLANTKSWEKWDYIYELDSQVVSEYIGPKFGSGAKRIWRSESSAGIIKIDSIDLNNKINYHLKFFKPITLDLTGHFNLIQDGGNCILTWRNQIILPFHKRFLGVFLKYLLDDGFKNGLSNLKDVCESSYDPYHLTLYKKPLYHVRSKEIKCLESEIGQRLEMCFQNLLREVYNLNSYVFGKPICYFQSLEGDTAIIEAALPVNYTSLALNKSFKASTVLRSTYVGAYDETQSAYDAMNNFLEANGLKSEQTHYQIFLTDPATEPDSSKWVTEIYYTIVDV